MRVELRRKLGHGLDVEEISGLSRLLQIHVKDVGVGRVHPLLRDYRLRGTLPLQSCVHKQVVTWQGEVRKSVRIHRPSTVDLLEGVVLVLRWCCEVIHKVHVGASSRTSHGELGSLEVHSRAG